MKKAYVSLIAVFHVSACVINLSHGQIPKKKFITAMDDDFNTPKALSVIFDAVTAGNTFLLRNNLKSAKAIKKLIKELCAGLGLDLKKTVIPKSDIEKDVEKLNDINIKIPITIIGRIADKSQKNIIVNPDGAAKPLIPTGYNHFTKQKLK